MKYLLILLFLFSTQGYSAIVKKSFVFNYNTIITNYNYLHSLKFLIFSILLSDILQVAFIKYAFLYPSLL